MNEEKLKELYRQWLSEQPSDTEIETIENHVSRFTFWAFSALELKAA